MNNLTSDIAPRAMTRTAMEDISPGDDVRARIHFLSTQNQAIVTQIQFADAKAAALMTVMSLVALRSPFSQSANVTQPLDLATYALLVVSILLSLWAVVPRYPKPDICSAILQSDKFTWVGLSCSAYKPEQHDVFARDCDLLDMVGSIARGNVGASRVLLRKFQALKFAFFAGIGAIVLMAVRYVPVSDIMALATANAAS